MQKGFGAIFILVGIVIMTAVAGGGYLLGKQNTSIIPPTEQKACTLEAKICPDGSGVGRTGPNCEFAACPNTSLSPSDETTNWKTYSTRKYTFKYPESWSDDVSEQKYSESGIILHTNDLEYIDYSSVQQGAFINVFFASETIPLGMFTLEEIVSTNVAQDKTRTLVSKTNIILDRQQAIKTISTASNSKIMNITFTYPDGKNYSWLELVSSSSEFDKNAEIFIKMLSTFKFTN